MDDEDEGKTCEKIRWKKEPVFGRKVRIYINDRFRVRDQKMNAYYIYINDEKKKQR